MISAAAFTQRLLAGDGAVIDTACLHRVVRETSLNRLHGRDAVKAAALAEIGIGAVTAATADVASWATDDGRRGHRWLLREGAWIARETLVVEGQGGDAASPVHAPLGELRSGRAQVGAGDVVLPAGWPAAARGIAGAVHALWNAGDYAALQALWAADVAWQGPGMAGDRSALLAWVRGLRAAFPDATILPERAQVAGDVVALLWRLHGHHHGPSYGPPTGRRIRLIGSSILRMADGVVVADDTLIDTAALAQQLATPPLVWRAAHG